MLGMIIRGEDNMNKVRKGTIVRTAVLILALINTSLQLMGWDVLPFGEQDLEVAITVILNVGASVSVWWKNNSFTPEGLEADRKLDELKKQRVKNK